MRKNKNEHLTDDRTFMLTGNPYDERIDVKTDVVIVYGHLNYEQRAQKWRQHQYKTHFMTGLSSGSYDDFISGKFNGEKHYHERQQNADGTRWERSPSVYQLTPTPAFIEYLKSIIKSIIDAGSEAIYLSEPEYAAETGYSSAFKDAWRSFYEQPWQDPWSSVQSRYMSGHLKQNLFLFAINKLFNFAKEYAASKGKPLQCYVAMQSLINYTHWGIVAPHSQLLDIPWCDGILAMVSTSTARTPNIYDGIRRERTFETALLEYNAFFNMAKGTRSKLIFMQDPVEDYPEYTWDDYKQNYEATLVASLMYPEVFHFLTIPWPKRIFTAQYRLNGSRANDKKTIPPEYATQILIINQALQQMHQARWTWDQNFPEVGILISDSMMLQRGGPSSSDQDLSFFYGLALPLVKNGVVPQLLPMEHAVYPGFLDSIRILIMSYAGMKPLRPDYHAILAEWVKAGNIIIYIDNFSDPFNKVVDWWNSDIYQYNSPAEHLFELLGLGRNPDFDDIYFVGRGRVVLHSEHPANFAQSREKRNEYLELVKHATHFLDRCRSRFRQQNYIKLRRGPYEIAAVFDESHSLKPLRIRGKLIDLFDPNLTYNRKFDLLPAERGLFYNLSQIDRRHVQIIASASSLKALSDINGKLTFTSFGPDNTDCITKIFMPKKPFKVTVRKDEQPYPFKMNYERFRKILTLQYKNDVAGIQIEILYPELRYQKSLQFFKKLFSGSNQKKQQKQQPEEEMVG